MRDRVRLDQLDRRILQILQREGRISIRELSSRLGVSKSAVSYRLKKYLRHGIIEGFYAKLDTKRIGLDYDLIIKVNCSQRGVKEREIAEHIAKLKGVQSVYQTFGPVDIYVIAKCRDRAAARELVTSIYNIEGVRLTDTVVVHNTVKESLAIDLDDLA